MTLSYQKSFDFLSLKYALNICVYLSSGH